MRRRHHKPPPNQVLGGDSFFKPKVQTKLKVGKAGDQYEMEADRMADQVVNKTSGDGAVQKMEGEEEVQQKPLADSITSIQRMEATEEEPVQKMEEEEAVQMMEEEEPVQKMEEEEAVQMMEEEEAVQSKEEEEPVQMMEEEEAVQAKCDNCEKEETAQKMEEEEAVQTKAVSKSKTPSQNTESRLKNPQGGSKMDHQTKAQMEYGFGADFSHINIHNDGTAAQMSQDMNAQAFAYGNDIYFNQGKYDPNSSKGKHLLAHELTHTIQQKGMVQKKVQRKKQESHAGLFELSKHNKIGGPTFAPQAQYDMKLEFNPYQIVNCQEIDFIQTGLAKVRGTPAFSSAADRNRALTAGEGTVGTSIDQLSGNPNPQYTRNTTGTQEGGTQLGKRTGNSKGTKAFLTDKPGFNGVTGSRTAGDTLSFDFETCAFCSKGKDKDVYYGCVSWGYNIDATNKFTEKPFGLVSRGTGSSDFNAAGKKWNAQAAPVATNNMPIPTHITNQNDLTVAQLITEIKKLKLKLKGLAKGNVDIPQITFELKVYEDLKKAISYNKSRGYSAKEIKGIQLETGASLTGTYNYNTIAKIKKWQVENSLHADGRFGPKSKKKFLKNALAHNKGLGHTKDQVKRIQRIVGSYPDGIWGPITTNKLIKWQKSKSLAATGKFTFLTQFLMFGFSGL